MFSSLCVLAKRFVRPSAVSNLRALSKRNASSAGEAIKFTIIDGDKEEFEVSLSPGENLHDAAIDAGVDLECACDGEAMCSTCHCIFTEDVFSALPPISEEEEDMLDLALGLQDTSRLACQIKYQPELNNCIITLPDEVADYY